MTKYRAFNPVQIGEIGSPAFDPELGPSHGGYVMPRKDDLLRRRGAGGGKAIRVYKDLLADPTVFAAFDKVVSEIVQRNWGVLPGSDSKLDAEIAQFVEQTLKNLGNSFDSEVGGALLVQPGLGYAQLTKGLLEAYITGISLAEIIWRFQGRAIIPSAVPIRDASRIQFISKPTGQVEPRFTTTRNLYPGEPLLPRSAIIHRYWAVDHDDPYGSGIGRQLYYLASYRKAELINWMSHGDRYTSPTAVAEYPPAMLEEELEKLEMALSQLDTRKYVMHATGVKINWLKADAEPKTYKDLLDYCDTLISDVICGESTVGQQSSQGSRARDQVADSVRVRKCKALSDQLNETLNGSLIKWIVDVNYGPQESYPRLYREFEDLETDLKPEEIVNLVSRLKDSGYDVPTEWLSKRLEMPIKLAQAADFQKELDLLDQ